MSEIIKLNQEFNEWLLPRVRGLSPEECDKYLKMLRDDIEKLIAISDAELKDIKNGY